MRIAIYIGNVLLLGNEWTGMVETLFLQLAMLEVDDEFVFITNSLSSDKLKQAKNCSIIMVPPEKRNSLLRNYWYDYTLPAILRKNKVDVLVSASGICSLRAKLPQILFIKDLAFYENSKKNVKKRFIKSLAKTAEVAITTQFSKAKLELNNGAVAEKISLVTNFANPLFRPSEWREKTAIKDSYSDGKEYFLVSCNDRPAMDWMPLLKAFSLFKKRQQSNMQLLIFDGMQVETAGFAKKMTTYKYRNEIKLLGDLPEHERTAIVAAAYCLVYLPLADVFAMPILQAIQSGVPIITLNNGDLAETAAGAALYVETNTAETVAEHMKTIYKDENLRNEMVALGLVQTKEFTFEKSVTAMWACIRKVMK